MRPDEDAHEAAYGGDRPEVQAHVPRDARVVLDLGCASGLLGAGLKARAGGGVVVVGVEADPARAAAAARRLDRVVSGDAAAFLGGPPPVEAPFDCVVAADVLEHLPDPWTALQQAVAWLRPGGTAVVSLPNVLFAGALLRVVRTRRWPRDPHGIFDETHLRWFTRADAEDLLTQAGLRDVAVDPRYFVEGAALRRRHLLARTPLAPFLPLQHVLTGVR